MTVVLHYNRHFPGGHNRRRVTEYLVDISCGLFGEVIDDPLCQRIKPCKIGVSGMSPKDETANLFWISRGQNPQVCS